MKFTTGQIVTTPGALATLNELNINPNTLIARHVCGDWGDMVDADKAVNDEAVTNNDRIFSSYTLAGERKLWIITEHDRSVTTLLLPEEY